MAQAVLRSVAVNAAKGSHRAQRHFTELLATTERDNKRESDELLHTAIEYKSSWEREMEYRKQHGISGPEPIPHPDDVVVDLRTGTVLFAGPMTKEGKHLDEDIEREEYMLAMKRFVERVLTGADPNQLEPPVRPTAAERLAAKFQDTQRELRKRGLLRPVLLSSRQ